MDKVLHNKQEILLKEELIQERFMNLDILLEN
jgi:hypothetical protein